MSVSHPVRLACREVVERLREELDGEDAVRIEQHLLVCPPCTSYVQQLRALVELAGELK